MLLKRRRRTPNYREVLKMENYEKIFIKENIHPGMSAKAHRELYGRKCFLLDLDNDSVFDDFYRAGYIYKTIVDMLPNDTILTREKVNEKLEGRGWGTLDEDDYEEGINQLIDWGFLIEEEEQVNDIPVMWFNW